MASEAHEASPVTPNTVSGATPKTTLSIRRDLRLEQGLQGKAGQEGLGEPVRQRLPGEMIQRNRTGDETAEGEIKNKEFIRAIQTGLLDRAKELCGNGDVNIDSVNNHGRNAVQIAARNGSLDILAWLQTEGANFHSRGPQGDNAFHLACWSAPSQYPSCPAVS